MDPSFIMQGFSKLKFSSHLLSWAAFCLLSGLALEPYELDATAASTTGLGAVGASPLSESASESVASSSSIF